MGLYNSLVRPALFSLDPEAAHNLGLWAVSHGLVSARTASRQVGQINLFGVDFSNRVGLAAGFDKNGVALDQWKNMGFGFVEVGTVTRHAQPGNPKPRLFRLPQDRAVINRMGFNNDGADALARRIEAASPGIPVGVNLGKSKLTPLEEAHDDYAYSYRLLAKLAAYVVVNVSSPNTPGLRTLQDRPQLTKILATLKEIDATVPLLIKVAPDLDQAALDDVVAVVEELDLTGIVATNTTLSRDGLSHDPKQDGGLSGAPLTSKADNVLAHLRTNCSPGRVLIGVGGIMSADDAKRKVRLGADLVQVYTGWVYSGPQFANELATALAMSESR